MGKRFTAMADPVTLAIISGGMKIAGANREAAGIKAAGKAQLQMAEYKAKQGRQIAGQERASSQRAAMDERRRGRLAQSRATALAAAGGGTVGDVSGILGELGAESEYSALTSLFEGNDRAQQLESQANLDIYDGESAYRTAKYQAKTAKMKGYTDAIMGFAGSPAGNSLYAKYAPKSETWANGDVFRSGESYGPFR